MRSRTRAPWSAGGGGEHDRTRTDLSFSTGGMMELAFYNDSTASLGSFIQVLASGRPFGRVFHINNVYRFSPGDEAPRGDADLQDENLERLKDKIRTKYQAGGA